MADDKIIDISESVVSLNVRLANLVIDCGDDGGKTMVPLSRWRPWCFQISMYQLPTLRLLVLRLTVE